MDRLKDRYPEKVTISLVIPRTDLAKARILAKEREQSLSGVIRLALKHELEDRATTAA
jgi:hypothetical protein